LFDNESLAFRETPRKRFLRASQIFPVSLQFPLRRIARGDNIRAMTPLREYLFEHRIRLTQFAADVGVPISTAHGWVTGRRTPPLHTAVKIEEITSGAVKVRDLVPVRAP
jgi:hypothetical protein